MILRESGEIGDKLKRRLFFFLEITMILGESGEIGDKLKQRLFFLEITMSLGEK